ncbi:hypothetical protein VTO73DRAFT_8357 [Trametes versicolor]
MAEEENVAGVARLGRCTERQRKLRDGPSRLGSTSQKERGSRVGASRVARAWLALRESRAPSASTPIPPYPSSLPATTTDPRAPPAWAATTSTLLSAHEYARYHPSTPPSHPSRTLTTGRPPASTWLPPPAAHSFKFRSHRDDAPRYQ